MVSFLLWIVVSSRGSMVFSLGKFGGGLVLFFFFIVWGVEIIYLIRIIILDNIRNINNKMVFRNLLKICICNYIIFL